MTWGALAAALAVLPADRLMMADRLFDRGDYARAEVEYRAVEGAEGIAADELDYRLAECARALGETNKACAAYARFLGRHPHSRHAARVRLMQALSAGPDDGRLAALRALDVDGVEPAVRAAALYHAGVLASDADALRRAAELDPDGRYALAAKFRRGEILSRSDDPAVRRAAIAELLAVHYAKDAALAREALHLAAVRSFGYGRYGEAAALLARYLRRYPEDARADEIRRLAAWSEYRAGRYAAAEAFCADVRTDDAAYLRAACAFAAGRRDEAAAGWRAYLESWPQGRYREAAELSLARHEFETAQKNENAQEALAAARRGVSLSTNAVDRLRLAWALEKTGQDAEACAEYTAIAADHPRTREAGEALFRKALADARAGRWPAAELALAETLATDPPAPRRGEALFWRGVAADRQGHGEAARGFLTDALAAGLSLDQAREAKLMLADADFAAERSAEAKAAYAALVREGALARMGAEKTLAVGRFLLSSVGGAPCPAEARACAKALAEKGGTPAWRQLAYALRGEAEEAESAYAAAAESYAKALAEDARTERAGETAFRLGVLRVRAGETARAEAALTEAVRLSSADPLRRCRSYLWLAKNAAAAGDPAKAALYATYVVSLFDDPDSVREAERILTTHGGAAP